MNIVVISGYFCAPLKTHKGYQQYISNAKKLGDIIIAIHANQDQCIKKYGKEMARQLFPDCYNIIAIDKDNTVKETLIKIKNTFTKDNIIFFKDGGEYNKTNLPEYNIEGIKYIFGDSPKVCSSSKILNINKHKG